MRATAAAAAAAAGPRMRHSRQRHQHWIWWWAVRQRQGWGGGGGRHSSSAAAAAAAAVATPTDTAAPAPPAAAVGVSATPVADDLPGQVFTYAMRRDRDLARYAEMATMRRQVAIEQEQLRKASDAYKRLFESLVEMNMASQTKSAQRVLLSWFEPLMDNIKAEIQLIKQHPKGKDRTFYGPIMLLLPPEKMAVVTITTIINALLSTGNTGVALAGLTMQIGRVLEAEHRLSLVRERLGAAAELVRELEKTGAPQRILKSTRRFIAQAEQPWSPLTHAKLGTILLTLLKETQPHALFHKIVAQKLAGESHPRRVGLLFCNTEIFDQLITVGYTAPTMRLLPMVSPPRPWRGVNEGPFYSHPSLVMRSRAPGQLAALNRAQGVHMERLYEALNCLGSVPWHINGPVLDVVQEAWATGETLGDLPSQVDLPEPRPEDSLLDMNDDAQRREFEALAKRVRDKNTAMYSLRCDTKLKLGIAEQFRDDNLFFPHNVDFRGRAYPMPPNLNHMGADLCRGLLTFAEAKPLGPNGLYWLKVHLANLFGVNKVAFEDRVAWVEDHWAEVCDSATRPLEGNRWWADADDPWQALAGCKELCQAVAAPDTEAYLSKFPVHMDGSCNGLQHYAALGRDEHGGAAVNLLPADKPQDVYMGVCNIVKRKIEEVLRRPPPDPETASPTEVREYAAAKLVHGLVDRKVVKQTVMTSVYGVTYIGARNQIQARLEEKLVKKGDVMTGEQEKQIFGAASFVARITMNSMEELFAEARDIMGWLAKCASLVSKNGHPISWITPLGLPVIQPYRMSRSWTVRTVLQNVTLSMSTDALPVAVRRQTTAFPPNFVHSLDSSHMLLTTVAMRKMGHLFTAVHDSYWSHPCNVEIMGDTLRDVFCELYERPILEDFRETLAIRFPDTEFPEIPQRGSLRLEDVKKSAYFFA